ncbi:E3 ubiquitin-protein ligase Rnf220-like [Rhodnius prolixus]|uniref:E3 ubiquitin-protein ligase Rnf220-like n=1 Tax=Rhodnius prolixus TaxID=13249 RepID=UPI003D18FAF8
MNEMLESKTDPSCCPVCGQTVRIGELDSHFIQELEKLYKLSASGRQRRSRTLLAATNDGSLESRWEAYLRIKSNRHCRMRMKSRKKKPDNVYCPICSENIYGDMHQLNNHVEICLRKNIMVAIQQLTPGSFQSLELVQNMRHKLLQLIQEKYFHGSFVERDEEETVDVEGEGEIETYEDYDWTLRPPFTLNSFHGERKADRLVGEETEESRRESVENLEFGPRQYTEHDLVVSLDEDSNNDPDTSGTLDSPLAHSNHSLNDAMNLKIKEKLLSLDELSKSNNLDSKQVVEALKNRIRDLEAETTGSKFICLICKDQYVKPLTSVGCWHVYCEQCWLHTLGVKKLCPQCNMITSPSDLRRIYLLQQNKTKRRQAKRIMLY